MRRFAVLTSVLALVVMAGVAVADNADLLKAWNIHKSMAASSPYKAVPWQWLGPTNHTGRMTSIAVAGDGPTRQIYVGAASGGVWKSEDRGETWKAVFDQEASSSIGDVAVAPSDSKIVFVGTGESNLFRASLTGSGIYKSVDSGKTWKHMGLTNTGTIGRILVHPTNPEIVYVAASGHEWTSSPDRGVFKSTNGGKDWTKVFFRSENTGAVDLVMDPTDPNTLYAGMWQRVRRRWSDPRVEPGYTEGGAWKTTDAGKTWTDINAGLTLPQHRGRIGIDVSLANPNVVYVIIDSYDTGRPANPGERDAYGRMLPANSNIIKGLEVFRSADKGATWKKVSGQTPETARQMMGLGNTYSWVFTQIKADTKDENVVYILALGVTVSKDGGATFTSYRAGGGDNHRMWIDPKDSKVTYVAADSGFIMTDDGGTTRKNGSGIHGTQFYNVELDNDTPFHAYGSVQDSGSYRVAIDVSKSRDLKAMDWQSAPGGEGSHHAADPTDPNIVYSHSFYGAFSRTDLRPPPPPPAGAAPAGGRGGRGNQATNIRPPVAAGEPEQRANWMAPVSISPHDNKTIYLGYQHVYRSTDRGDHWEKISGDLTDNNPAKMGVNPSAIPFQTITQIVESPRKQGLIYVGTDDGRVHMTNDAGKTWTDLTANIPMTSRKWVSRVVASKYNDGTVYVAHRGREEDDFGVYLWRSNDFGKTWKSLAANIPAGSINVIREDPAVPTILYAANDFGVYVSNNGGLRWNVLGSGLPSVEVSDLQIQPRDSIIVISTYGRGMYALDALKVRAIR
jgi:photosystem II stability/assembly factor-like uncharacterized protein